METRHKSQREALFTKHWQTQPCCIKALLAWPWHGQGGRRERALLFVLAHARSRLRDMLGRDVRTDASLQAATPEHLRISATSIADFGRPSQGCLRAIGPSFRNVGMISRAKCCHCFGESTSFRRDALGKAVISGGQDCGQFMISQFLSSWSVTIC